MPDAVPDALTSSPADAATDAVPEPTEIVRAYWELMQARDWAGLRRVLAPDVVVEWTASNEQFVGPDAVIGVNRAYPEGWSVRVPMDDVGVFRVAAFAQVRGGLLVSSVEYWIGVGDDDPPAWRARYSRPADSALLTHTRGPRDSD